MELKNRQLPYNLIYFEVIIRYVQTLQYELLEFTIIFVVLKKTIR